MTSTEESDKKSVILETSVEAIRAAKDIMRLSRYGAIAVLEAETSHPIVTRTNCALTMEGDPVFLMSDLAAHTKGLKQDARSSLMLGEPGKGDPLAHPRLTLIGNTTAVGTVTDSEQKREALQRGRYITRHPKAELYNQLPDFHLYQMKIERALFNAGFGKAYTLTRADLILPDEMTSNLKHAESGIISHMNEDHGDAIDHYAKEHCNHQGENWRMTGCDPEGVDLMRGDEAARLNFETPCLTAEDMRKMLINLAQR